LRGLRNYSRYTGLGRGTKFDPLYLGRFLSYPYDFLRNNRQVGPLPNKPKTTHRRPYFYFRFYRKHALSRWSCVCVLL